MAGTTPISGSGALATVLFRVAPGARIDTITTLALADAQLYDGVGRNVVASALQRTITRINGRLHVIPMRIALPIVVK